MMQGSSDAMYLINTVFAVVLLYVFAARRGTGSLTLMLLIVDLDNLLIELKYTLSLLSIVK